MGLFTCKSIFGTNEFIYLQIDLFCELKKVIILSISFSLSAIYYHVYFSGSSFLCILVFNTLTFKLSFSKEKGKG